MGVNRWAVFIRDYTVTPAIPIILLVTPCLRMMMVYPAAVVIASPGAKQKLCL